MIPDNLIPEGSALKRWVYLDDVIKYTGNPDIIKDEIEKLLSRRTPVEIRQGNIRSFTTIILDFSKDILLLDIPARWIPIKGKATLAYSIKGQPHREMRTEILSTGPKGVRLRFPYILAESEHRQFYRISVPSVSMLIAYSEGEKSGKKRIIFEGKIRDISMKGICSLTTNIYVSEELSPTSKVSEILLKLMLSSSDYFGDIVIKEPKIVRCSKRGLKQDGERGYELAFTFKPDSKTSDRLFTYMRQRELTLMK